MTYHLTKTFRHRKGCDENNHTYENPDTWHEK